MLKNKSIVLYKNDVALVSGEPSGGKFTIQYRTSPASGTKKAVYATQSVREKDIVLLHEGPAASLENILDNAEKSAPSQDELYNLEQTNPLFVKIKEAYELLISDDETAKNPIEFSELTALFSDSDVGAEFVN